MEYLLAVLIVAVLVIWDKYFRRHRSRYSEPGSAPDIISDADRGNRE